MSSQLYRNLLDLLPLFRVNHKREGKCLGLMLRKKVSEAFPDGERSTVANTDLWERNVLALRELSSNTDQKAFPRLYNSSVSELQPEACSAKIEEYFHKNSKDGSAANSLKENLNNQAEL